MIEVREVVNTAFFLLNLKFIYDSSHENEVGKWHKVMEFPN